MHRSILTALILLSILAFNANADEDGSRPEDSGADKSVLDTNHHYLFPDNYVGNMGWADVDLDGDVDLALLHFESEKALLTLYRNEGEMEFIAYEEFQLPEGEVRKILFADIDGDHYPDLLLARFRGPNSVHRNDGTGGFESRGTLLGLQADMSYSMTSSDIDEDGDNDLLVPNQGKTKRYLNSGRGQFSAGRAINREASEARAIVAGDVDGDGDMDLVLGTHYGYIFLYRNYGDGTFDSDGIALTKVRLGSIGQLRLADADGDTDLDLFAASRSDLVYFRNQGDGSFDSRESLDGSMYVLTGDMDLDGDIDIVTSPARVMLNSGAGEWSRVDKRLDESHAREVTLQDIDNDNDLDLVFIPQQRHGVWVNLNSTNVSQGSE